MKYTMHLLSAAAAAALFSVPALSLAQQAPKPEQLIKWRQSAFQVIGWSTGRIKANLEGQYNKDEVQRAANTLAAVANGGLSALFAPGSDKGKGWHDTSTRPEAFSNTAGFGEQGAAFARESQALAALAGGGDVAALKVQFAKVQRTCKGCHDDFKAKD